MSFYWFFLITEEENQTLSELPTVIVVRAERRTAHRESGPVTSQEVTEIIADPVADSGPVPNKKGRSKTALNTFSSIFLLFRTDK